MDIDAIHGEGINPVDSQKLMQVAEDAKAAEQRLALSVDKADNSNVSPEALRVAELVEQVEAQEDVRADKVQQAVNSLEAGIYNDPDVLSRTSSNMLELM